LFKQSIFAAIAIVSIAASVSAEAKPRHHKQHRIAHATIVCNDRGCSDHRATARPARQVIKTVARHKARHAHRNRAGIRTFAVRHMPRAVEARVERRVRYESRQTSQRESRREVRQRVRHAQGRQAHVGAAVIVCNQQGCSDRVLAARAENAMASVDARHVIDANGNGIVVGSRPTGCPNAFCGCEASRYVFGEMRRELYLASNWIRRFPRASPAPGMAAARSGHVMILISHVGGNDWLVHDGNSGGGKTRDHVMSISRYVIVDPRSSRSAQR
jgi:hypothetical protein